MAIDALPWGGREGSLTHRLLLCIAKAVKYHDADAPKQLVGG